MLKIAHRIPGILETAIQNCRSFKGAFDYLLADGVSLAEEEIAALLEMNRLRLLRKAGDSASWKEKPDQR